MRLLPRRCLFLLLAAALLAVADNVPGEDNSPLARGDRFLAAGEPDAAIPEFTAALVHDPDNQTLLYKRAAAYLALRRYHSALQDLDAVLGKNAGWVKARLERARTRLRVGMVTEAVQDLEQCIKEAPEEVSKEDQALVEAWRAAAKDLDSAHAATEAQDWVTAADASGRVLKYVSADAKLRLLRARALIQAALAETDVSVQRNRIEDAANEYSRAAALDPSDTDAHLAAARLLYLSLRRYEAAVAMLKAALKNNPEHPACTKEFKRIKKLEKAVKAIEEERQAKHWTQVTKKVTGGATGTDEAGAWGDARANMREVEKAFGFVEGALRVRDVEGQLAAWACLAYGELKLLEKTIRWCTDARKVLPKHDSFFVDACIALGDAYLLKEDLDAALAEFQLASDANESDSRVQERMARTKRLVNAAASRRDYYKILDVPKDGSQRDIKKAWKKLAQQWHPDKYSGDLPREKVAERMSEINLAYEVLGDETKRTEYDQGRDPNDPMQQSGGSGQPFFYSQGGDPFQFFFQGGGGGGHQHHFGGGGGFEFKF